jgi:branched-chain amino acid transport system ATP-binding protein
MMSDGPQLALYDVDVFYGASQILFGVDLEVEAGAIMALMGRNGAGKSTTFKAVAGLAPPRAGRILLAGKDIAGIPPYRIARAGVGYVPEDRQVFPEHSVHENLEIAEKPGPSGDAYWSFARVYETFPMLERLRSRHAGRLSGGEQQMLAIARTLMGNPAIILLDEPSEGLSPLIVEEIVRLLHRLREMGATILLAEQNMNFCLAVARDVAIIDKGQIVYRGTAAALRADAAITRRYLAV